MLTKGAIGNLVNRYRAVLKKCNLINTFGSLAVASMLVLGGAGVAEAAYPSIRGETPGTCPNSVTSDIVYEYILSNKGAITTVGSPDKNERYDITIDPKGTTQQSIFVSDYPNNAKSSELYVYAKNLTIYSVNPTHKANIYVYNSGNIDHRHILYLDVNETITMDLNYITGILVHTGSLFTIDANKTIINARNCTDEAIRVLEKSTFDVRGDFFLDAEGTIALDVRNSTVTIGKKKETVQITGDIRFSSLSGAKYDATDEQGNPIKDIIAKADSNVDITFSGKDSYWKGDPYMEWGSVPSTEYLDVRGLHITLENGGTWWPKNSTDKKLDVSSDELGGSNAEKFIAVPTVTLNGGNINIPPKSVDADGNSIGEIIVIKTDGSGGNINFIEEADPDKRGTFKFKENTAKLNVQVIDKDGNVKTADDITPAEAHEYQQQVQNTDGEVADTTASAPRGKVMDSFVLDSNGNIISGGDVSTITKSVLELASVNTVALDKVLTNDVRKRMGDLRSDKNQTGVWMRWDGGRLKGNAGLTNDFNTIQIGGDTKVGKNCRLGVAASFTHGDSEFDRGSSQLEGFSFAGYTTWMGENGMFADIVARIGHFSNDMSVEGDKGDIDSRVASLSGEYGWRFSVCDQFFIEPQVELAYTYVSSDDIRLGDARFSFDSVDSLTGRAGLVAGWNLPDDMGSVYARASVLQQFMGDAKVTGFSGIGPTVHKTDGEDTWLEYGVGANIKLNDKTYIWADIERTEGAKVEEEWRIPN